MKSYHHRCTFLLSARVPSLDNSVDSAYKDTATMYGITVITSEQELYERAAVWCSYSATKLKGGVM